MSNDFFSASSYTALARNTKARAGAVEAIFSAIVAGFDRLPSRDKLTQDRTTFSADTGTANAYAVTLDPAPTSYVAGLTVRFKAANANTGNSTLNVNGLGASPLRKDTSVELASADILVGQIVEATYDGANFQMTSVPGSVAAGASGAASSATAAAASAAAAATSASSAATSASDANTSASGILYRWGGTSGGSANAQTLTPSPSISAYTQGQRFPFVAGFSNTGALTLAVSGLTATAVKKSDGTSALVTGDVIAGSLYTAQYDGTVFRLTEGDRDLAAVTAPDVFSGDGVDTTFTLSRDPVTENAIDVYVAGVYQAKSTFSVSGTTLTFSVAPASGANNIQVEYKAVQGTEGTPTDGSVSTAKIVDDAVTLAKMEHGTQGDVLYYGAAGAPARLAAGSAGQVLTSGGAGANPSFSAAGGVPTGSSFPFRGRTAPSGYLLEDGSAVSRTTYAALFAVICPDIGTFTVTIASPAVVTLTAHGMETGERIRLKTTGALPTGLAVLTDYFVNKTGANTFSLSLTQGGANINTSGSQSGTHTAQWFAHGAGDGSTTFNVPDSRGYADVGGDAMGGSAASRVTTGGSGVFGAAIGAVGGSQTHTLTTAQMPSHNHSIPVTTAGGVQNDIITTADSVNQNATKTSGSAGSGQAHNNVQPVKITLKIIKT